jgi:GMP synthase (glutamine-hydrolysing)
MQDNPLVVFDFGSQYTQLIAKNLRKLGYYTLICPYFEKLNNIKKLQPKGFVFSGGPASIYDKDAYKVDDGVFDMGLPILGVCYGMQLIVHKFGGEVSRANHHEYGKAKLDIISNNKISQNLKNHTVWMSHSDKVVKLPKGFETIASSENSPYAMIYNKNKKIYACQFHPEVTHTEDGDKILQNFAKDICSCTKSWTMGNFAKQTIQDIQTTVGDKKVLCAVSGGVDSSVVATMLHEAIGEKLICVFVDNGLLRADEVVQVQNMFAQRGIALITIDAAKLFLHSLADVSDPEKKRKIIGKTFIDVFSTEAKKHNGIEFLAQGTLYTDIIESVSVKGPSKTIKSHHNVGGLPDDMSFKLIEPLKEIFKDEVRLLGAEIGLSRQMISRHPFPGPGLAIRIMGCVHELSLQLVRACDTILIEELNSSGYYDKTWQAFAVLLNVRSVGVMGDNRTYDNTICIRIVDGVDGMTATFSKVPFEILEVISRRIVNEVSGINRVVYDITSKPPSTIEWE